jgi:hypothetical protein
MKPGELSVYMHPVEVSQLLAALVALRPRVCLEWGSGGSTRAILEQCPFVRRFVSIEHQASWCEIVRQSVSDPRLELHLIEADHPPALTPGLAEKKAKVVISEWDMRAETEPELMASYVAFPRSMGIQFDFVLVDGRARRFCLEAGYQLLGPGGLLVLHDAQRTEYRDVIERLGFSVFLSPWHQGQLCLIARKAG